MGDRALIELAGLLLQGFRDSDVLARLGRGEFCVLLTGTSRAGVAIPLQRFANSVSVRNSSSNQKYGLASSVGTVFLSHQDRRPIADLLCAADELMYEQKRRKRESERDLVASPHT